MYAVYWAVAGEGLCRDRDGVWCRAVRCRAVCQPTGAFQDSMACVVERNSGGGAHAESLVVGARADLIVRRLVLFPCKTNARANEPWYIVDIRRRRRLYRLRLRTSDSTTTPSDCILLICHLSVIGHGPPSPLTSFEMSIIIIITMKSYGLKYIGQFWQKDGPTDRQNHGPPTCIR